MHGTVGMSVNVCRHAVGRLFCRMKYMANAHLVEREQVHTLYIYMYMHMYTHPAHFGVCAHV